MVFADASFANLTALLALTTTTASATQTDDFLFGQLKDVWLSGADQCVKRKRGKGKEKEEAAQIDAVKENEGERQQIFELFIRSQIIYLFVDFSFCFDFYPVCLSLSACVRKSGRECLHLGGTDTGTASQAQSSAFWETHVLHTHRHRHTLLTTVYLSPCLSALLLTFTNTIDIRNCRLCVWPFVWLSSCVLQRASERARVRGFTDWLKICGLLAPSAHSHSLIGLNLFFLLLLPFSLLLVTGRSLALDLINSPPRLLSSDDNDDKNRNFKRFWSQFNAVPSDDEGCQSDHNQQPQTFWYHILSR